MSKAPQEMKSAAVIEQPVCAPPVQEPTFWNDYATIGAIGIFIFVGLSVIGSYWLIGKGATKEQIEEWKKEED